MIERISSLSFLLAGIVVIIFLSGIFFVPNAVFALISCNSDNICDVGFGGDPCEQTQKNCSDFSACKTCFSSCKNICEGIGKVVSHCRGNGDVLDTNCTCESGGDACVLQQLGCPAGKTCLDNPLVVLSFWDLLDRIAQLMFIAGIAISPLFLVWGAFQFITAAGDTRKVTAAKNTIKYAVIGVALVVFARALIAVVVNIIGG